MHRINTILLFITIIFSFLIYSDQKLVLNDLEFNTSNWDFDSTNGIYYQIGLKYCTNIVNIDYQTMAIYVPKEFLSCNENGDKYKCDINKSGKKGWFSASNAPIVFPVETPGYSAMKAPTSYKYETVSAYVTKGIIFAYAGCRGRYEGGETFPAGAPWGVTDLKTAIRYLRYNKNFIPGDTGKIYTFGFSGGGAQSCLMGVTGNSELYTKYLENNGAAMEDSEGNKIKDNVKGSQCWCPITNLDTADEAYEWNMGQYYNIDTRAEGKFTEVLSKDLAGEYVKYVNDIKLKDPKGNELTLTETNSGTYYDYLKSIIEESLNNFLSDTTFPWTRKDEKPGPRPENLEEEKTFNTISEYISFLNSENEWVKYDSTKNKYIITNIGDFVKNCKSASKKVGAFDDLNRNQAENQVFGISGTNYSKHFDKIMYNLLNNNKEKYQTKSDWKDSYPDDYLNDFDDKDSLQSEISYRLNMYNPMYYLISYYQGFNTSDVADYFRINSGIFQSDTGNVVEMNLYLALMNLGKKVNFTNVWEKQHTKAERKGDSDTNFINWIAEIENVNDDTPNFSNNINFNYFINLLGLLLLL